MRRKALITGLGSASIALSMLSGIIGCSYEKVFPSSVPTLSNEIAIDRALRLCSLTQGEMPFHLMLEVSPPRQAAKDMRAQIEIYWMNPSTYRTVIRSPKFSQVRIVNGSAVEEHDTGDFYPRWIQNFVDALLQPVPGLKALRKTEGAIPVSTASHACISDPEHPVGIGEETMQRSVCFLDSDPKLASGRDFTRYVSFDDFAPFGSQQVARTLVNVLPANTLVNGRIVRLEPLPESDYKLLKTHQYTPPANQIQTRLVPQAIAESLLVYPLGEPWLAASSMPPDNPPPDNLTGQPQAHMTIYIRTDRTGRVREAYRDNADIYGMQTAAVAHALTYRFKPLIVRGVAQQMEAPITLPSKFPQRP